MASQITNYKCPACTGPLHFVGASGMLECDFCGAKYDVAQIEAMYAEKEAAAVAATEKAEEKAEANRQKLADMEAQGWDTSGLNNQWGAEADGMKAYSCPSCGAELICDETGIHVDPDMLKMVVRTKGVEKIILITDSMPADGDYKNNEADGIAWGPDLNYDYEGHLAGSHLTLDSACRNLMAHTGYGLCHAIRMASLNPAKLLGLDRELGSIAPGKKANLLLIDDLVHVKKVFLAGREV